MTRFSRARLAALSLALALVMPHAGLTQERDDVFDDSLPDAATAQAENGYLLPDGWAWHEIVIALSGDDATYPVRIGFPGDFFVIDEETMPGFAEDDGSVAFTDTDLTAMGAAVMAGESGPYGTTATIGVSHRAELPGVERDRAFSETSRGTVTLEGGITMTRLSGALEEGGFRMAVEVFEGQLPIAGNAFLTVMFMGYDDRLERSGMAEGVVQSLAIASLAAAHAGDDVAPDEPLVLLDGALIITALPEGWTLFNQRDGAVTFRSVDGYQGFIAIETGSRAEAAADLSVSFTGTPTQRRGEIMGLPARLFEGRQTHDAFLQGFHMVPGSRVLALADACLPDGARLAVTWAGSPLWFEQGAFDRFFEAARFDGLVPCSSATETPPVTPPPVTPTISGTGTLPPQPQAEAQPQPAPLQTEPGAPPAKPELAAASPPVPPQPVLPQPVLPQPVAPQPLALRGAEGDADVAASQAEILYWESVRDMDTPAAFEAYLIRWPDGQFAALAQLRLARLGAAEPAHGAPPSDDRATAAACEHLTGTTINDPFAAIAACRSALASHPGNPDLHYRLSRSLQARGSDAEAIDHLRQAADGGVPAAMTALALAYRQGQGVTRDDAMAVHWYRAGAEAGDAQAMNNLGYMYGQGLGGLRPDPAEAARWYLRAAEAGSVFAMNNIGRFYLDGRGVVQDHAQARYWLQRGAEAGHHPAMNNLGGMYAMGQGGPVDHHQAMAWFRRAADEGHAPAMANIALAYSNGQGVAASPEQAARWFEQSIRGGAGDSVLGVLDGLPRPVIRAVQQRLNAAGVYAGAIDGVIGPQTRNAVRALDGQGE